MVGVGLSVGTTQTLLQGKVPLLKSSFPVRESSGLFCDPYLMQTWGVPKREVSSGFVFWEWSPHVCLLWADVLSAYWEYSWRAYPEPGPVHTHILV